VVDQPGLRRAERAAAGAKAAREWVDDPHFDLGYHMRHISLFAGTLGAYHRERRVRVDTLNCMVPMNLRGKDERDTLGNRVGTFTVRLPIGERAARRRLELVTAQTRAAKSDRRGAAAPLFLQGIGLLPGFAFRWIARQSLGRVNIACTNVPGDSPDPLHGQRPRRGDLPVRQRRRRHTGGDRPAVLCQRDVRRHRHRPRGDPRSTAPARPVRQGPDGDGDARRHRPVAAR